MGRQPRLSRARNVHGLPHRHQLHHLWNDALEAAAATSAHRIRLYTLIIRREILRLRNRADHKTVRRYGRADSAQNDTQSYFRRVAPMRNLSTPAAALRPSEIAHTTSDCPRRISPAAKMPGTELI